MDERVNKWKFFGYVILTWLIAKAAFELDTKSSVDLIIVNVTLWAVAALIMGIYMAHKFKKPIDFANKKRKSRYKWDIENPVPTIKSLFGG